MGCKASKPGQTKASSKRSSGDVAHFHRLVTEENHPVAIRLFEEWNAFVDAQVKRSVGDEAGYRAYMDNRKRESWATTDSQPLSHRSVDEVGKTFLEYLKHDLSKRGWGGNFDYSVAGVAKQGFIKVSAIVDTTNAAAVESAAETTDSSWDVKIHYHSRGPS